MSTHPYASASSSRASRPPVSTYQSSDSSRKRSSSLGLRGPYPPPPSNPPQIPLPAPPVGETESTDWFSTVLLPQSQSTSASPAQYTSPLPPAPRSRPSTAHSYTPSSTHSYHTTPAGLPQPPPPNAKVVRPSTTESVGTSTDSDYPLVPSRPGSRASGASSPVGLMRRLSSVSAPRLGARRSRSKSRSRAASDADPGAGQSASDAPSVSDTPTPRERERDKAKERAPSQPSRAHGFVDRLLGKNSTKPTSSTTSSPAMTPPPTSPPSLPLGTLSDEWVNLADDDSPARTPVPRRKTSVPAASGWETGRSGLDRRPSQALGGRSAAATPTEEDPGRSRSNSYPRHTASPAPGRSTPTARQPGVQPFLNPLLPLPPSPLPPSLHDGSPSHPYHIAVIGPRQCGKSHLIQRGLKEWKASDAEDVCDDAGRVLYQLRTVKMEHLIQGQGTVTMHYCILEVDTESIVWFPPLVWPEWLPYIDGVLLCYDSSRRETSFGITDRVSCITELSLPMVLIATKSDLPEAVRATTIGSRVRNFNVGIIVSSRDERGKVGMKHLFRWMCKVVTGESRDERLSAMTPSFSTPVTSAPTPRPSRPPTPRAAAALAPAPTAVLPPESNTASIPAPAPRASSRPPTPTEPEPDPDPDPDSEPTDRLSTPTPTPLRPRAHSYAPEPAQLQLLQPALLSASMSTGNLLEMEKQAERAEREMKEMEREEEVKAEAESGAKQPTYMYCTLEQLCDRVFFAAIADSDPVFLYHFFLTYRKFTTVKFVLREWQKFWERLDDPELNTTMKLWGKLRLGHLITDWVLNFPQDFSHEITHKAVRNTYRILNREPYTMRHATSLKRLLRKIDRNADPDRRWGSKNVDSDGESYFEEEETAVPRSGRKGSNARGSTFTLSPSYASEFSTLASRNQTPRGAGVKKKPSVLQASSSYDRRALYDEKQFVREFQKTADAVEKLAPAVVAREITRLEIPLFLDIEPRDWPRHVWLPAKQRGYPDPVDCMAVHFMRVQTWVTSLILSREGAKARSQTIAYFCFVGHELRRLSNFNSLRAVHVGVRDALPNAPDVLHAYISAPRVWRMFQYHDLLFSPARNYLMYHRTLANTPVFAIPSFEIHTSYLIRGERNKDWHPENSDLVHWGRFAIFGKTIDAVTKFQERQPPNLPDAYYAPRFRQLFVEQPLMSAALMDKRRAPEHFVDRTAFDRAKNFFTPSRSEPSEISGFVPPFLS